MGNIGGRGGGAAGAGEAAAGRAAGRAQGGVAGGVGLESWRAGQELAPWFAGGPRVGWRHGDVVMRRQGSLLGYHGNDSVVQPATHGFVTVGRVLVRNQEAGLPSAPLTSSRRSSSVFFVMMTLLVFIHFFLCKNS